MRLKWSFSFRKFLLVPILLVWKGRLGLKVGEAGQDWSNEIEVDFCICVELSSLVNLKHSLHDNEIEISSLVIFSVAFRLFSSFS